MPAPVLRDILRQHAEQAAFLWTVYDRALLHPKENPEMDEVRIARVVERLEAHLDGLKVAGEAGREIAEERLAEYSKAGELFVLRMLRAKGAGFSIRELDLSRVRAFLAAHLKVD